MQRSFQRALDWSIVAKYQVGVRSRTSLSANIGPPNGLRSWVELSPLTAQIEVFSSIVGLDEAQGVQAIGARVNPAAVIHADEARGWDVLHDRFLTKRIDHSTCYSDGEACKNQAESFFSRLRRAEIGIHHHISGRYLAAYAGEMAWRENNRRVSNGAQYLGVTAAALNAPVSRQWKGYWQRGNF